MQINQYAVEATEIFRDDLFDTDKEISPGVYQSQKVTSQTMVLSFIDDYPELTDNLYIVDGVLTGDRELQQAGFDLMFTGGKFAVGTTNTSFPYRVRIEGDGLGGAYINGGGYFNSVGGHAGAFASTSRGIGSFAPSNIIRKNQLGIIPSADPSSIWDVFSDDQGVRLFPENADPETNISAPANGLIAQNTSINYPQIFHPAYGWQSIGYGRIQLTIDFSVTPITSPVVLSTLIPIGKVIHKMIAVGDSIDILTGATLLIIGLDSDPGYFVSPILTVNSGDGASIDVNSTRTLSSNEDLTISADDGVNSGILHLTIYHT